MKTTQILSYVMLLIPFNAFAHPGHAEAGLSSSQLLSIFVLAGLGMLAAATRLYRRRKAVRLDD
jgi:hypothetical protein